MPLPVKLNEVVDALDSAFEEMQQYLDRRTGEILLITDEDKSVGEDDELLCDVPTWQRESVLKAREILNSEEFFAALPDKFDVDEYHIMQAFGAAYRNRQIGEDLLHLIRGSGAFGRFKTAIRSLGIENDWHQFRREELEKIAIEWLNQEGIPYTRM